MNEKASSSTHTSAGQAGWSHPSAQDASQAGSKAMEGARELAQNAKHVAGDVVEQARKTAESQVANNKTRAVDSLNSVATAIRKTGEHLRAEDQAGLTTYFDRAATQVDAAAGYIRSRTIGEIASDVEGFARREPALFLGGAFVAGLVGGRFLKSSTAAASSSSPSSRSSTSASPALGTGRSANEHWQGATGSVNDYRRPAQGAQRSTGDAGAQASRGGRPQDPWRTEETGSSVSVRDVRDTTPSNASPQGASKPSQATSASSASTPKNGNAPRDATAPKTPGAS